MARAYKIGPVSGIVAALALGLAEVGSGGVARHALVIEVLVSFTDSKILVSPNGLTQAGPVMFFVTNKGHKLHVLTIKGPGMRSAQQQPVRPGATALLHLKLVTGAYALSDPAGLGKANVHWFVVSSNTVGPPVNAPVTKKASTTAIVPGGM